QRLAGEELENVARAGGLANAFRQGLALFARQQPAQLFLARQDLVADRVQDVGAALAGSAGPFVGGRVGGGDGLAGLGGVGLRILADDVGQVGGVDVGADVDAIDPVPAYVVRMHVSLP